MSGIPGEGLDNPQVQIVAVTTTCLVLSTLTVLFRFLARWCSAAKIWWDDWVSVLALVTSWLLNILTIIGIRYGLGRHTSQVDPKNMTPFGVVVFVQQIVWALSSGLIIFAILLFYIRLFPTRWMRNAIYIIGAWDTVWTISTILVTVFRCTPFDYPWKWNDLGGECINSDAFYFASSLISTLTIATVLFLPLPIIWKLHTSATRKTGLAISFTIGAFACIASVIRLVVLREFDATDPMYTSAPLQLWSCVEVSFGVISACLPSLTPLFLILLGKRPAGSRQASFSLRRQRAGEIRTAESYHMADSTAGGQARSQSLELMIRDRDAGDRVDNLNGSWRSILVTRQVDQVIDTHIPRAEQVADASTGKV